MNEWVSESKQVTPCLLSTSILSFFFPLSFLYTFCSSNFLSEITQSGHYESCYLSLHPHPTSLSAIPLTIVWQSEQTDRNKGEGPFFLKKRECQLSVWLWCWNQFRPSNFYCILKERRKKNDTEIECVYSQKEQVEGGKRKAARVHAR